MSQDLQTNAAGAIIYGWSLLNSLQQQGVVGPFGLINNARALLRRAKAAAAAAQNFAKAVRLADLAAQMLKKGR